MISVNTFFEKINYKEIVALLVDAMAAISEEFVADQTRFDEAISLLEAELGQEASPSMADMVESIYRRIGSTLLFSFFLGLKANLDHFIDPIGHTFLDVDPEIYLREDVAQQLPDHQSALRMQKQFYATLSPAQTERYEEAITTYICHLETVGPKVAHYYGYIMGNQLLPRLIPGYVADAQFTLSYRQALDSYWGTSIKSDTNQTALILNAFQ